MRENAGMKRRVVIIDDDHNFINLMQDLLSAQGIDVVGYDCAMEGVQQALKSPPDLILLDVMMPDIDGMQALDHLKADGRLVDTQILMVTNLPPTKVEMKAAESGAGYLSKAVPPEAIVSRVKKALHIF